MATATKSKTFEYSVRDKRGKLVNGKLEAPNETALIQKLRGMGYAPLKVKETNAGLSMEISVIPFLSAIALTWAAPSPAFWEMTVPCRSGIWVAKTCKGMPYWRTGSKHRGCRTLAPLLAISCASS